MYVNSSPATLSSYAALYSEPSACQLRFTNEIITNYVVDLLKNVSDMFPSTLFSAGGDEVNTYGTDELTQAALNATCRTLEQALDTFTVV